MTLNQTFTFASQQSRAQFQHENIFRYRYSYYKEEIVVRPSNPYHDNSYIGKAAFHIKNSLENIEPGAYGLCITYIGSFVKVDPLQNKQVSKAHFHWHASGTTLSTPYPFTDTESISNRIK